MRTKTDAFRTRAMTARHSMRKCLIQSRGSWYGNVLLDGDRWWITDWDDLKIGDPAHDLSMILFTAAKDAAQTAP